MKLLASASHRLMAERRGQWLLALLGMAAGVAVMSGVWLMQQALHGRGRLPRACQADGSKHK